jgi:hypothetical protein
MNSGARIFPDRNDQGAVIMLLRGEAKDSAENLPILEGLGVWETFEMASKRNGSLAH